MHLRRRAAALHASSPEQPTTHNPQTSQLLCITVEGQCAGEEAKAELVKVCGLRGVSEDLRDARVC